MTKKLVLAEKPSVAKELARILGANQSHKTYYEGPNYIVTWAYGHLLTLKMPEDLKPAWQQWDMAQLPMLPKQIGIKPLPKTRSQLKAIAQLAKRSDVSAGIIATDSGRAGELLARWIFDWIKFTKPLERLWISSQTERAVKAGFAHLQPAQAYDHLYESELARTTADWLIGLNVTRALTLKYQDTLNAGRVQTPTLNLVNQAQERVAHFRPQSYYQVKLSVAGSTATLRLNQPHTLDTRQKAEAKVEQLSGHPAIVQHVMTKQKSVSAPLPYDLTAIQRLANARYQYSAHKTLSVIQSLYETHKVVSYPRTDSRYLSTDLQDTMKERLRVLAGFNSDAKRFLKQGAQVTRKTVFNDSKVTDHYALIPTEERPRFEKMTTDETRIYRLIVAQFLGLFAEPQVTETTTVDIAVAQDHFQIQQSRVIQSGWQFDLLTQPAIIALHEGQQLTPHYQVKQEFTQAPPLLSEGELLAKMATKNLGTPATRAEIIEKLLKATLMERQGRNLQVTPKGQQLLKLVNPSLATPELTAQWEITLEQIAQGQESAAQFIQTITQDTKRLVTEIKQSTAEYHDYALTNKICPECGQKLRERSTRDGHIYVCSNPDCKYRRRKDPKTSNHRCPNCHKKMQIIDGPNGAYFRCRFDGTTEKMMDKKDRRKKISKHETQRLMKQLNQEDDDVESPFAALKNLYK